jgi:hypothetical protein
MLETPKKPGASPDYLRPIIFPFSLFIFLLFLLAVFSFFIAYSGQTVFSGPEYAAERLKVREIPREVESQPVPRTEVAWEEGKPEHALWPEDPQCQGFVTRFAKVLARLPTLGV